MTRIYGSNERKDLMPIKLERIKKLRKKRKIDRNGLSRKDIVSQLQKKKILISGNTQIAEHCYYFIKDNCQFLSST